MHHLTRYLLALCLLAGFSHAGTWVENFDDGNIDRWRLIPGSDPHRAQVNVVDGELVFRHLKIGAVADYLILEASRYWSDYTLELRLKFTDETGPNDPRAIMISYNDTFDTIPEGGPNAPFLLITTSHIDGMLAKNGNWYFPTSAPFTLVPGTWYQLRILVQGSHYELFIDGQHVLAYDDATFTSGGVGIGARDVVVHFDDVRISGDSVPDGGATSVEAAGKLAVTWAALK